MSTTIHLHYDISDMLQQPDDALLAMMRGGTAAEIRTQLVIMKARGKVGLTVGGCDNVAPDGTCAGHAR